MTMMLQEHALVLPTERSRGYKNWMELLNGRFERAMPFSGPAHTVMTLGSGLSPSLSALNLKESVTIPFSAIGLPEGANTKHPKNIIAGFTPDGKKIIAFTGRTALFEVDPEGVETEAGHVSSSEAAMAYLEVVKNVGTDNLILTTASGAINHPRFPLGRSPFPKGKLPVIGVIGADITWGYPMEHIGHHTADHKSFFPLVDSDDTLTEAFIQSMADTSPGIQVPILYYASIPAAFEDRGLAHFLATNGIQAIGMTYGPEKTHLSGMATGIGRFLGLTVITDEVELYDPKKPHRITPISIMELNLRRPQEFKIKHPASDDEVRATAALANDRLGAALAHLVRNI